MNFLLYILNTHKNFARENERMIKRKRNLRRWSPSLPLSRFDFLRKIASFRSPSSFLLVVHLKAFERSLSELLPFG